MPIYEYECPNCGHRYEFYHASSSSTFPHCPRCGTLGGTRLMSKNTFHLKGPGWAKDSYRSKKQS